MRLNLERVSHAGPHKMTPQFDIDTPRVYLHMESRPVDHFRLSHLCKCLHGEPAYWIIAELSFPYWMRNGALLPSASRVDVLSAGRS